MLPLKHSVILLTFIKLPFVIKTFVLSIFEWPFYTGFTVFRLQVSMPRKCHYHRPTQGTVHASKNVAVKVKQPGLAVIKLDFILKLKIKRNDWLLVDFLKLKIKRNDWLLVDFLKFKIKRNDWLLADSSASSQSLRFF